MSGFSLFAAVTIAAIAGYLLGWFIARRQPQISDDQEPKTETAHVASVTPIASSDGAQLARKNSEMRLDSMRDSLYGLQRMVSKLDQDLRIREDERNRFDPKKPDGSSWKVMSRLVLGDEIPPPKTPYSALLTIGSDDFHGETNEGILLAISRVVAEEAPKAADRVKRHHELSAMGDVERSREVAKLTSQQSDAMNKDWEVYKLGSRYELFRVTFAVSGMYYGVVNFVADSDTKRQKITALAEQSARSWGAFGSGGVLDHRPEYWSFEPILIESISPVDGVEQEAAKYLADTDLKATYD